MTTDGKWQMLSDFRYALSLFSRNYRIHHRINEHGNTVSSATLRETPGDRRDSQLEVVRGR
jgi:hypothetical protein